MELDQHAIDNHLDRLVRSIDPNQRKNDAKHAFCATLDGLFQDWSSVPRHFQLQRNGSFLYTNVHQWRRKILLCRRRLRVDKLRVELESSTHDRPRIHSLPDSEKASPTINKMLLRQLSDSFLETRQSIQHRHREILAGISSWSWP